MPTRAAAKRDGVTFDAYVSSVSVRYTMFRHDGTPYRATATVTLTEHSVLPARQNPTSGTLVRHAIHTTVAGDSLASIAYHRYGKPSYWRAIADANAIDDPLRVPTGLALIIPPVEEAVRLS